MTVDLVEPGQVWEHRNTSLLDKGRRCRYVVTRADVEDLVSVRDLDERDRPVAGAYTRPRALFGSLDKGGLRLAGHMVDGHVDPVDELDERRLDHIRVVGNRVPTYIIPGSAAAHG